MDRGALGAVTARYEDATRVPRMLARRGAGNSCLEAVGTGPTRTPRWCGALRAAHSAAKLAGHPARRQRSRARPIHFSAGQPYFDRAYLQKFELYDKKW
jgi:hypothetical protein